MGQALCADGPTGQQASRPGESSQPQIWGDYLDRDTRMILVAMDYCGDQNKTFHPINSIDEQKNELRSEPYKSINPTGRIPTLIEGSYKVLGSADLNILFYLMETHTKMGDMLYPKEQQTKIDAWLTLYNKFRVQCSDMNNLLKKKLFTVNKLEEKEEDILIAKRKEVGNVMNVLEKKLMQGDKKYFLGEEITLPDIVFYIEINCILKMDSDRDIKQEDYPKLRHWYKHSMAIRAIVASNQEYDKVLSVHRH